jgi:hypothetical protein
MPGKPPFSSDTVDIVAILIGLGLALFVRVGIIHAVSF